MKNIKQTLFRAIALTYLLVGLVPYYTMLYVGEAFLMITAIMGDIATYLVKKTK